MSRDQLIAEVQSRPCKPCGEGDGAPRYRDVEACHCTYCGYTVCLQCYNSIPTALLFPSRNSAGEGGRNVRPRLEARRRAIEALASDIEDFQKPRCHLCCTGTLLFESAPVHQWTCEGPLPDRRLRPRAAYDMDYLQRYHTMKEQQKTRSLCNDSLVAHFHGADAPPNLFAPASTAAHDRRPFCEEGSGFVFSVENPRVEQSCVWCAVTRIARESHPAITGEETITPLLTWLCPPSLPGIASRRFRTRVPYGAYALHGVHALSLYLVDDIYRKATSTLHMSSAASRVPSSVGMAANGSAHLSAGKKLPRSFVRPLLVVDVLHRVATAEPIPQLLPSSAQWQKGGETFNSCSQHEDQSNRSTKEAFAENSLEWPGGLRCPELLLAVDHILQGRSVAVYGIASKYFFLHHIAQSAELRSHGVEVVDGYRMNATQVSRQLRAVSRRLQEQQRRVEHSAVQQSHPFGAPTARRSAAPSRGFAETPPPVQAGTAEFAVDVDASASTSVRSSASPVRSQSYRPPYATRNGGTGSPVPPIESSAPPAGSPAVPAGPSAVPAESPVGLAGPQAWSRRHRLRDTVSWGFSIPNGPPARSPRWIISSPQIATALQRACRAPLQQCVAWLALPSSTAQRLVPGATQIHCAAMVLVVHGVDQLDSSALLELRALALGHTYRIVLLCSFDDPAWPASEAAAMLDAFRVAYVHLRSLLLPRVHEMAATNRLALLSDLESCRADGGRRNTFGSSGNRTIATLPMQDTIRRILFSLPTTFAELLRRMIERQEKSGENVYVPMALHQEHFDECGVLVSMGRLRAIERELTSNRIAVFSAAENKLMIPQHRKLLKVLEEVTAERQRENDNSAAVEA